MLYLDEDELGMVKIHKSVLEYFQEGIKKCDRMMQRYRDEIDDLEKENRVLREKIYLDE